MSRLKLIPMGGMGNVTQNMYVYEYGDEILIVDCGIGFPDVYMPGVDTIIPDISYLLERIKKGKKIVGMVLTHGHEDHIGAMGYILPDLPDFPIWGSPLTVGFAEQRMKDKGVGRKVQPLMDKKQVEISKHFAVTSLAMTHSIPDTKHIVIDTPEGVIYHGSDFKLDKNPVDKINPDLDFVAELGKEGVLLALLDCLRVEKKQWVKSESTVGPVFESLLDSTKGRFIVTLMSSHIHRIQQLTDAATKRGRKLAFVGRSVEQNVKVAMGMGMLHINKADIIDKRDIKDYPGDKLCVIIAGSQGQEGSSMMRAVYGDHRQLQIRENDKVVFSADAIPGNEIPYYNAIDELCRNKVEVIYPDVEPDIHQSGHASAEEQREIISLLKPKYVMPIGGADRHREKFREYVAQPLGYDDNHLLLPRSGEVLAITGDFGKDPNNTNGVMTKVEVIDHVNLKPRAVDGLGIGDVGKVVLSDRLSLSQAGIIVLLLHRKNNRFDMSKTEVVSRGFVFMKEADEVIEFIKLKTAEIMDTLNSKAKDDEIKRAIDKRLSRRLYKVIKREPLIVPVIIEN